MEVVEGIVFTGKVPRYFVSELIFKGYLNIDLYGV